jgi:hypothetical protein
MAALTSAAQLAELVAGEPLLDLAAAQQPDAPQSPWAASGAPADGGASTAWLSLTGPPPSGPVAGFVVDAWTEAVPVLQAVSGIAVHFDAPSAAAPNAVLLAVTRPGDVFTVDYVRRCVTGALQVAQFRALGADAAHSLGGQFLPATLLAGDTAVSG